MTRRKAPPPEVDAWQRSRLYRIGSWALLLQHAMVATCALMWFVTPSASIEATLDPVWSGSWSALFLIFTVIGAIARIREVPQVEAACNIVVAIAVWLWSMTIIVVTLQSSNGGLQTGFMLLAFAADLWGWSLIQIAWVRRQETEAERLKRQVATLLAQERAKIATTQEG